MTNSNPKNIRLVLIGCMIIQLLLTSYILAPYINEKQVSKEHITLQKWPSAYSDEKDECTVSLVETIPVGLKYNSSVQYTSTYQAWSKLIDSAETSIEIASMYWTMTRLDVPDTTATLGEMIFEQLRTAGKDRNVTLKIVESKRNKNTEKLIKTANAQIRILDFHKIFGHGILHTKLWIIDRKRVYVGSANMDWRALTQVKELGLMTTTCPKIANDLGKIFDVYWLLAEKNVVPDKWPNELNTDINVENPLTLHFADNAYKSFFASSPLILNPNGRVNDLDAILLTIARAKKFIYISVMDYLPIIADDDKIKYWPTIDDALKKAALERKIEVRLLISLWKHSSTAEAYFLKSLTDITDIYNGVKVLMKRFKVPATPEQDTIPFSRVNHNKYMVTDNTAYIGTSNWRGDYFTYTGGIGMVFQSDQSNSPSDLRWQLESIFSRDWNSSYAHSSV